MGSINPAHELQILAHEEAEAWSHYYKMVRGKTGKLYEDVESWVGLELDRQLNRIKSRRQELECAST